MSYGKLLFAASISITIWCSSAVAQHTFNRDDGTFSAPDTTDTTFTASGSGAIQRYVDAHIKDGPINAKDFGASGSNTATTGTINAGSAALTLAAAIDFANGQGIRVNHAGAAYALNSPTGLGVVNAGTPGSTTYTYTVSCFDSNGGIGAALSTAATATGNATLSLTNYNTVSWTAPSGTAPAGCAVWGNIAGALSLRAVLPGTVVAWNDYGLAAITAPDWLGATPPASAAADWKITTVSAGGGTTTLTLAATATTAATTQVVAHDDLAAIQNAIDSLSPNGGVVFSPTGTYNLNSYILVGAFPIRFEGAGWGSTYFKGVSPDQDIIRQPSNSPGTVSYSDFFLDSDFFRVGGGGIDMRGGTYVSVNRIHTRHMFQAFIVKATILRMDAFDIRETTPTYGVGVYVNGASDQILVNGVMDTSYGQMAGGEPRACIEAVQNGGSKIMYGGYLHCGIAALLVDPGNGQTVKWMSGLGATFDTSSGDGILIAPTGTGSVSGMFFTETWSSSFAKAGVHIANTGGSIRGLNFTAHRSLNNQQEGFLIESGDSITINGSLISGNSQGHNGVSDGIHVTSATGLTLIGNRSGNIAEYTSNQRYGIRFETGGTVTGAIIIGNDTTDNVTGSLSLAGTLTQQQEFGNYPSTGEEAVAMGGNLTVTGATASAGFMGNGSAPTATGTCAIKTQVGANNAGSFVANGACVGGTVILAQTKGAAHGFTCSAHNQTAPTGLMNETSSTTTSVTFTGSMADNDVIAFSCMGY